jgi:hypothetical protein
VIPELPASTLVVFAGRLAPSRGWFEHGWDQVVLTLELAPLATSESNELLARRGVVDDALRAELVRRSEGSPLALVVGAETGPNGTLADLVERLIGDEVDADRFRTLSVAAIARVTTPALLAEVNGDGDAHESYKWLAERSFCESLADGLTLHALVAESLRQRLRERDPQGEGALRRRIADVLHRRALVGQSGLSTDLQHLIVDQALRWGYSSGIGATYRIDRVEQGDADQVGAILNAVDMSDWWGLTRLFFDQHPEHVGVARDRHGKVGGYYVAVTPANAPPLAEQDVLLGPWLRHARTELATTNAVLWREAVDLTGEVGEVTALLGAGGLLGSGVDNPRYVFLPISPTIPAARTFSERLGAVHVPSLDVIAFGQHLECHIADFGPGGLLGTQRDWIYRETGAVPPGDPVEDIDHAALLKSLRDPAGLAHGPRWLGTTPAERLTTLRQRVTDGLDVFGASEDDELARTIIEHAFLSHVESHEVIARRLHLSRSAYFRRLHAAIERVAGEVLAAARASH